jgi:hypothetical protein
MNRPFVHPLVVSCVAILVVASVATARAATPPAFLIQRDREDYSALRDVPERGGWQRWKFIPLDADGSVYLSLGGEVRLRGEGIRNPGWGASPIDSDTYLQQRTLLHADLHLGPRARVFTQLQSAGVADRAGRASPVERDRLDLHQAWTEWSFTEALSLRGGRQELVYGSSRLIGFREGPNTRLAFDAARLRHANAGATTDAFVARPVSNDDGVFDNDAETRRTLWGLYHTTPPLAGGPTRADLYYLGNRDRAARYASGAGVETRHSLGLRVFGRQTRGWDWNAELVGQAGRFDDRDIRAYTLGTDTGFTFEGSWQPRLFLRANLISGDRDGGDLGTFNALYPRGAYFGELAAIGPANLINLHPGLELRPTSRLSVTFEAVWFWREQTSDGLYAPSGNLVRPPGGSDARYVGLQPQLDVQWRAGPWLTLRATGSWFEAGDFLRETGADETILFGQLGATWKF